MNSQEKFDEIVSYLFEQGNSSSSSWEHGEMFSSALFLKFKDAYDKGWCTGTDNNVAEITGDKLRDSVVTRLSSAGMEDLPERTLERIVLMWDEWRYALDSYK